MSSEWPVNLSECFSYGIHVIIHRTIISSENVEIKMCNRYSQVGGRQETLFVLRK